MGYSEDADFEAPEETEDLITQSCFRCKDRAVIDRSALKYIPAVMARADTLLAECQLWSRDHVEPERIFEVRNQLKQYIILLDTVPQD